MDDADEDVLKRHLESAESIDDGQSAKKTRKDEDGTEYEWDEKMKGWFPKVDTNFLAAYQISYGENAVRDSTAAGVYIDPDTKKEYRWDQASFTWVNINDPKDSLAPRVESYTDPSSGKVYKLNRSTNQWVDEQYIDPNTGTVYFWDIEKGQYLPPGGMEDEEEDDDEEKKTVSVDSAKPAQNPAFNKKAPPQWFEVDESKNSNVYVSNLPLDITHQQFEQLMSKCGIIMLDPDTDKPKIKLYKTEDGKSNKGDGRCCYLKVESVDLALQLLDGSEFMGNTISVQRAQFTLKGEFKPGKRKKKKKKPKQNQEKLLDWRPEAHLQTRLRCEKVVILKNVFDPRQTMADLSIVVQLKQKLEQVCQRFGDYKKINVFDLHDEGVVSVAFKDWNSADLCVEQLNNRQFNGRPITAQLWDGKTDYHIQETPEQEAARIARWENELVAASAPDNTVDDATHPGDNPSPPPDESNRNDN